MPYLQLRMMYSVTLLHAFFADLSKITGLLVFDQSQQGIHLFKMSKEEMEQLRSKYWCEEHLLFKIYKMKMTVVN
jgi:hypothetical protein